MVAIRVDEECQKIFDAYRISLNPLSSNEEKQQAFHFLESFKSKPEQCFSIGSVLVSSDDLYKKLLGFELLICFVQEGWARNDWDSASLKAKFKWEIILFVQNYNNQFHDDHLIQNSISKLFTMVFLHEFPQKWPDVLPTLYETMTVSKEKKLLVFSIFQRVAEELINSPHKSIPVSRTKDIRQYLTRMPNLEPMFKCCHDDFAASLLRKEQNVQIEDVRVSQALLACLNELIGWVPLELITKYGLREQLLNFLNDCNFRLLAADCIISLLQRKGCDITERALAISFFKQTSLQYLNSAVEPLKQATVSENGYTFLKKMMELYSAMNDYYSMVQNKFVDELNSVRSEEYSQYLSNMFSLSNFSSHFLHLEVLNIFVANVKTASKNPYCSMYALHAKKVYDMALFALTKVGFPSKMNHASCWYTVIDFGDDLEFGSFIGQLRSCGCESVRSLYELSPKMLADIVIEDFATSANKWCFSAEKDPLEHHFLEAKSLAFCTFLAKIPLDKDKNPNFELHLQKVFTFCLDACEKEKNVVVLNALLSVVSALFHYWFQSQEVFVRVIKLLFSSMQREEFENSEQDRKAHVVHRHASSLFLSKVMEHHELFIPFYNDFYPILTSFLFEKSLDKACRSCILESLVILTSYTEDPLRSETLKSVFLFAFEELSAIVSVRFISIDAFMDLLSLRNFSGEKFVNWEDMMTLKFCSCCIGGFIRRIVNCLEQRKESESSKNVPQVPDKEAFITFASQTAMLAAPIVMNMLCRFHELHNPEVKASFCKDLKDALEMSMAERKNILGVQSAVVEAFENIEKQPLDKLQTYLKDLHNTLLQFLCGCTLLLMLEKKCNFEMIEKMLNVAFYNFDKVSNTYIASSIKFFLIPIKDKCPENLHGTVLIPIFNFVFPKIFRRLSNDWTVLTSRPDLVLPGQNGDQDEEILEDLFLRRNSRSMISIIESSCIVAQFGPRDDLNKGTDNQVDEDNNDSEMKDVAPRATPTSLKPREELKNFAHLLIKNESLYETVLLILVNAFVWPDTHCCSKAVRLFWAIFQPMIEQGTTDSIIGLIFTQLLKGYQVHEYSNSSSAHLAALIFKFFVTLRPKHEVLRKILSQVPEVNTHVLDEFESRVFETYSSPGKDMPVEKKTKDIMRKLLKGIVGRPVSVLYQKKIQVNELPKLPRAVKTESETEEHFETNSLYQFF